MRSVIWIFLTFLSQQEMSFPWLPDRISVCVGEKSSDRAMWIPMTLFCSEPWFVPAFCWVCSVSYTCILYGSKSCPNTHIFILLAFSAPFEMSGMQCLTQRPSHPCYPHRFSKITPDKKRLKLASSQWKPSFYGLNFSCRFTVQQKALKEKIWKAATACGALCFWEWSQVLYANASY